MEITVKQLENLEAGVWLSKPLGKGNGVFTVRRTAEGVAFYFRYTLPDGKRDTYKFGTYDKIGANGGFTLAQANEKVSELSKIYREHSHLRLYLEEQAYLEQDRIKRERRERDVSNLAALLNGYVEWLEQQGKTRTAQDVKGIFRRRVLVPFPELATTKAGSITTPNLTSVIAATIETGAGREAAKLRSYLSAAFSAALTADTDPTIPPCLQGFLLESNPVLSVRLSSLKKFNKARDRFLTKIEFRECWQRMKALQGPGGSILRLCILLGGQRPFQLLRLQTRDVNFEDSIITIYDDKGRRSEPRRHVLPLTDQAKRELLVLMDVNHPFIFSSTKGKVPLNIKTISNYILLISREMIADGVSREPFQLRDLRRTVETQLASLSVSKDTRGQLQSHGLSSVQDRHYDWHHYLPEKKAAMEKLWHCLMDEPAQIVPVPLAESSA